MLYSLDSETYIDYIPHKHEYRTWINRLAEKEIEAIHEKLNQMIEGDEMHTSSWLPGSDWSGTAFHPIFETACRYNEDAAGMCFGLMLWHVLKDRADVWGFGRYEKNGIPIQGMTYFKINNPPTK